MVQRNEKGQFVKGHKVLKEWINKFIEAQKGKKHSEKTKRNISETLKGRKHSEKTKRLMSESQKGEKGSNWQGGISPTNERIRKGIEARLWREAVFARDNWTCQKCGERGKKLHSHHIQNFAQFPKQRFAIDNGVTFCDKCHRKFHKKYGRKNNTREQLNKYIKNGYL